MSSLTKLAATSLVHVWPAVDLTSAGSYGTLQFVFQSGCLSSPEWFGAVVFEHSPTLIVFFLFSIPLSWSVLTGASNGGSWLGCTDLPAMGAVFYLGAGWAQRKPLDTPGTHLPFKRGSGQLGTGCLKVVISCLSCVSDCSAPSSPF